MRLIDADALIDYCNNLNDKTIDANDIARFPTAVGWIRVKDKLPKVGKVVLAFGTRSATTGMFQGVSARNDLWWWKGHTIKHVSHWMPIPNLPKECDDDAPDRC